MEGHRAPTHLLFLPTQFLSFPQGRSLHLPAQAPPTLPLGPAWQTELHTLAQFLDPLGVHCLPSEEDFWQKPAAQAQEAS